MERRTYIAAIGSATAVGLAGCVGDLGLEDDDNGDEDEGSGDDDHGAVAAVEAYMEASANEDLETMSELTHSLYPFDPAEMAAQAEEDDDRTFEIDEIDDYEVELADEEITTDDVAETPLMRAYADENEEFDLEDAFDGEAAALVDTTTETTEDGETVTEDETHIVLTEDGEWRVFFPYQEPREAPEDDPVEGEAYRIVEDLEFDESEETVMVHLERSFEIDVEEVVAYSTSLGTENWAEGSDDTEGFPVTGFTTGFDPAGDEIVVTAVVDGEELVVHRESYEP